MKSVNDVSCCLSDDEAKAKRMLSVMQVFEDFGSVGSLWWVDESVWMENVSRYDSGSTRRSHPGVSIRREIPKTTFELVPFLHGRSRKCRDSVRVDGVSSEENHPTYFGGIRPVSLGLNLFCYEVRQNKRKPRLSDVEMKKLEQWLSEKGVV